jgi:LAO/AO transport system kinase
VLHRRLLRQVLKGDRRAISRAITVLEDDLPGSKELYRELYARGGHAYVIGVAGPPGGGKSSLINCMVKEFRSRGNKVGVVAVDPTSPFTGGALLGDRVRMVDHSLDEGVYIRSMASRGSGGGLSRNTRKAIAALDAARFDYVLLETVGTGQTEVDVIKMAHVTAVVLMPETGDSIQAMKAGLMEIADVFVINKADLMGADKAAMEISAFLKEKDGWRPPVVMTVAKTCDGVKELVDVLLRYKSHTTGRFVSGDASRWRAIEEVKDALHERLEREFQEKVKGSEHWAGIIEAVIRRKLDPESAAELLMNDEKTAKRIGRSGKRRQEGF